MAEIAQTKEQLNTQYDDAIYFLKSSSSAFDDGYKAESMRMAVTVRVLLHNTSNRHRS